MSVKVGEAVPDFPLTGTEGAPARWSELRGKQVVLYFYPKDNTPGCSKESAEFGDRHGEFAAHNTVILGVSRDSLASHEKFRDKFALPFPLLSDGEEELCRLFGVIKKKSLYGRSFLGVERSTFLIGEDGVLLREWRKVKVKGHVEEVLAAVKAT